MGLTVKKGSQKGSQKGFFPEGAQNALSTLSLYGVIFMLLVCLERGRHHLSKFWTVLAAAGQCQERLLSSMPCPMLGDSGQIH